MAYLHFATFPVILSFRNTRIERQMSNGFYWKTLPRQALSKNMQEITHHSLTSLEIVIIFFQFLLNQLANIYLSFPRALFFFSFENDS